MWRFPRLLAGIGTQSTVSAASPADRCQTQNAFKLSGIHGAEDGFCELTRLNTGTSKSTSCSLFVCSRRIWTCHWQ